MLFHDESSITKGGYESAIAPILVGIASYIPKSFITEKTPIAQLFGKKYRKMMSIFFPTRWGKRGT